MSVAEPLLAADDREKPDIHSDEPLFEVIDGLRVELLVSAQNSYLATRLTILIGSQMLARPFGHMTCETLFELPLTDRSRHRRPDLAFVSFDRWAVDRPLPERGEHWPVAPDLAVEFVSPNDESEELQEKLHEYFEAGVREVWVVHPRSRVVYLYRSLTDVQGFQEPAEIDGGDLLPGIRVPVSTMFPPRSVP